MPYQIAKLSVLQLFMQQSRLVRGIQERNKIALGRLAFYADVLWIPRTSRGTTVGAQSRDDGKCVYETTADVSEITAGAWNDRILDA